MQRSTIPTQAGFVSNPYANYGKVNNQGYDLSVTYNKRFNDDWAMSLRGTVTYAKNEILEKDEENTVYPYQTEAGYRVNQAKGLIALGLFKDYDDIRNSPQQTAWGKVQPGDIKYKDVNGDGVINDGDKVAIGATTK